MNYSDGERAITRTWIIEEVTKAIEIGYQILEVFGIWEYDTMHLDKENGKLSTKIMNKFIEIKQDGQITVKLLNENNNEKFLKRGCEVNIGLR